MPEATIWAQPGATLERLGSGRSAGIVPEGVSYTWDQHGPSKASFTLKRQSGVPWPDLAALTPIDIDVHGARVWSGRISEAPQQAGDQNVISVQCEGWQAHLEDDLTTKLYVHTNVGDFVDSRSRSDASLAIGQLYAAAQVSNDNGTIQLAAPSALALLAGSHVAVRIDMGPGRTAKRIVLGWTSSNNNANFSLYCRGSNTSGDDVVSGLAADQETLTGFPFTNTSAASGTTAGSFTTSRRYVYFMMYCGAGLTTAADIWFKLTAIQIFGSTAWESGNASILKATDVIKDLLPLAPLLSQTDTSQITTSSFSIPELYVSNPSTPGEIMRAVNAYHDWLLQVDQYKRVVFAAKPTTPSISIGQWSNAQIQDTSAGTATDVYNKALLSGTAPNGTALLVTRTSTSTLLTARGLTRTKAIPIDGPTTTAALNQLGDTFLSSHTAQPFKGSIAGKGMGAFRNASGGGAFPPHLVPTLAGRLVRLDHWIDPDTGGLGRDGRIAEATYTVDDDTVNISLDNTRSNFEAFLGRLQVLTATALNT